MVAYKDLNLKQVQSVAEILAGSLKGRQALIGLSGPLGSGKTTFTKAFAKKFGIKKVTSPTFVIRHDHRGLKGSVYHFDFYRLQKAQQLIDLGLTELFGEKNVIIIEWVEKFPQIKKLCDILITFKIKPANLRDLTIKTN